jgi:transcriptional regulator with XRE-family HTH domain
MARAVSNATGNKKTPSAIDVHVGSRVRLRRTMQNMSQEKLGTALGISFQQIQKYEKGTNRIGASRMHQIASALEVPVSFFFEDAPGPDGETVSGFGEATTSDYVVDFVSTKEGIELNRAFVRITNSAIRKRIIDMVRTFADETGLPENNGK